MAVVIGNSEDKITDEKIEILYREEIKNGEDLNTLKIKYKHLEKSQKEALREKIFSEVLRNTYEFIKTSILDNDFFIKYIENEKEEENLKALREDLYYNLEEFLKEFNDSNTKDESEKEKVLSFLADWKVLNELRPHPEFQNLPNVYNFISKMCAEQADDKKMLMDTYLETLPTSSPIVQQFATAQIAPSKTRASFFTSALATLNIFVDDYVASMINEAEIDINNFNKEKTALFMILPDEKTTFYGLCSLFVNQAYTKLCELADAKGRKT